MVRGCCSALRRREGPAKEAIQSHPCSARVYPQSYWSPQNTQRKSISSTPVCWNPKEVHDTIEIYCLVPATNSSDTSRNLDNRNAASHLMPGPKQASTWHHCVLCQSNSARTPQASPPRASSCVLPLLAHPITVCGWKRALSRQDKSMTMQHRHRLMLTLLVQLHFLKLASKCTTVCLHLIPFSHLKRSR